MNYGEEFDLYDRVPNCPCRATVKANGGQLFYDEIESLSGLLKNILCGCRLDEEKVAELRLAGLTWIRDIVQPVNEGWITFPFSDPQWTVSDEVSNDEGRLKDAIRELAQKVQERFGVRISVAEKQEKPETPPPQLPAAATGDDLLSRLDRAVCERVISGQSALQIALTNDLIADIGEGWYEECMQVLVDRLQGRRAYESVNRMLRMVPYATKILWFRTCFEKYDGRNYKDTFCQALELPVGAIGDFGEQEPFAFHNLKGFWMHVWCLRFMRDTTGYANGITSVTARALRRVDNMTYGEALNPMCDEYHRVDAYTDTNQEYHEQDICSHLRAVMGSQWRNDYFDFISAYKNQRYQQANMPDWIKTLCESCNRLIADFQRKELGQPEVRLQLPDVLPDIDANGCVQLVRPNEHATYANGDCFLFYRRGELSPFTRWKFCDNQFEVFGDDRIIIQSVERIEFYSSRTGKITSDILKFFTTGTSEHIGVYGVKQDDRAQHGYSLDLRTDRRDCPVVASREKTEALREGAYYKVVPFSIEMPAVVAYSAEHPDGIQLALTEFSPGRDDLTGNPIETGVFRVPVGTLEVQIVDIRFPIRDSRIDLLKHDDGRNLDVRNCNGGPAGYRFYYNKNVYPLNDGETDGFARVSALSYEFGGRSYELPLDGNRETWNTPQSWFWHRDGRLVIVTTDRRIRKFPVTFVDVDFSNLEDPPFALMERRPVRLRIGNCTFDRVVEPDDSKVVVDVNGFKFAPKVNRQGVQIILASKTISLRENNTPEVDIAYDDICDSETRLRINLSDDDRCFFVGDSRITGLGRRNGEMKLYSLGMDISKYKDSLPIVCSVAYPSEIGAYKFCVYDPKASLMANGANLNDEMRVAIDVPPADSPDDLYLRYFTSFKCHTPGLLKELAVMPAHRQDRDPYLMPLEVNDEPDADPENRGRCVESAVVKGFFSKDIDWGNGVIAFVVVRGIDGSYTALTTGFFIPARNPMTPNFDGDVLKELRRALSERQVRNNAVMTNQDRDRLSRITCEFMTDTVDKRNAIKEYINKAATVAYKLGALESINSFGNRIRNRDGHLAWVSGYAFMAGWYVKEMIRDGVLECFGSRAWHRLLVAYRYQEPERLELGVVACQNNLYKELESASQKEECVPLLNHLARMMEKKFAPLRGERLIEMVLQQSLMIPCLSLCVFYSDSLLRNRVELSYNWIFASIGALGIALDRWRTNPTLNDSLCAEIPALTVQNLKECLYLVDEIDNEFNVFIEDMAKRRPFGKLIEVVATTLYFNRQQRENENVAV